MVIGDKAQIQWASDDGEPQGTSGAPIVRLLVSSEITGGGRLWSPDISAVLNWELVDS